jgi:hypothetical protein
MCRLNEEIQGLSRIGCDRPISRYWKPKQQGNENGWKCLSNGANHFGIEPRYVQNFIISP